MTRALIMAGGADEKWNLRGGEGRRHFQLIAGERVIDRIVRQLHERGVSDVGIICPDMPGYVIEGTYRVEPTRSEWGHEGLNGEAYWSDTERTLLVYGDCVFSDRAMDRIVRYRPQQFQAFGRHGRTGRTGRGGELFAISFWPNQRAIWKDALVRTFGMKRRGLIPRAGSWEAYRYIAACRKPRMPERVIAAIVQKHRRYPQWFTDISDATDDFDIPAHLDKLRTLFEL